MFGTFKYNLINNWNFIRVVRLALSIIIIVQAIQIHDVLFGLFGSFFMYQALTNTGCCGVNGCATMGIDKQRNTDDVDFTELK